VAEERCVLDSEKALGRRDLVAAWGTLLGAAPLRGEGMSTNYFSSLSPGINGYIADACEKMWAGTMRSTSCLAPTSRRGGYPVTACC